VKRLNVCRIDSSYGEIHIILEDPLSAECFECQKDSDIDDIKRSSKKEATKPLFLFREE
jgi:hypothetical protein